LTIYFIVESFITIQKTDVRPFYYQMSDSLKYIFSQSKMV